MKKISKSLFALFSVSIFIISCNPKESSPKPIAFNTDYKFKSEILKKLDLDTIPWKHQLAAAAFSSNGDYKNALYQYDFAMRVVDRKFEEQVIDSLRLKYTSINAKDYIINEAQKNSVLIINEAHHNAMHRLFTKSLLQDLYNSGYRLFGVEGLTVGAEYDKKLNQRKYPDLESGFYIKDPQFGDLIREALQIGFTLFSYDNVGGRNDAEREIGQAKNLQAVIEANPKSKVLIYCGFNHVYEGKHGKWGKAMAGRLEEFTGINPLTVDQVAYSEKSNATYNHPLLKVFSPSESSVLQDANGDVLGYKRGTSYTDIAVFHPNTNYKNGRPNWLFNAPNQAVEISLKNITIDFPVIVQAFLENEPIEKAIPIDLTEVTKQTDTCVLGLKPGNYKIVVTNKNESYSINKVVK